MSLVATAPVCSYFLRNSCAHGDKCRFRHPRSQPDSAPTRNSASPATATCPHFIRGACLFGDRCRLSHIQPAATPFVPAASVVPFTPAALSTRVPAPSSTAPEPQTCPFFARGTCRYGDQCRLPHGSPASRALEPAAPSTATSSPFGACKFFAKGLCNKGAACPFPHPKPASAPDVTPNWRSTSRKTTDAQDKLLVNGKLATGKGATPDLAAAMNKLSISEKSVEINEPHLDNLDVTRTYLGCDVTFSAGAEVRSIVTPFESAHVVVSDLPPNTNTEELVELAHPFGELLTATMDPLSSLLRPSARLHYSKPAEGLQAAEGLDGMELRGVKIAARMDLRRGTSGSAVLSSTKVKVGWFAPSQIAWAHYPSIAAARRAASQLQGVSIGGRQIRATFQTPSYRQTESFSVELKNLPLHTTRSTLLHLCKCSSLTMGRPVSGSDDAQIVRQLLLAHGPLDSLDLLPMSEAKSKFTAFAQFHSPDAAASAVKALHDQRQHSLRNSPIWLEIIHAMKVTLPHGQFVALRSDVEALKVAHSDAKLRYYDSNDVGEPVDPVTIRVYGSDPKAVGKMKVELDRILGGMLLSSDKIAIWDDYFASDPAKQFLESLASAESFVKADLRTRTLRLYGSDNGKERVRSRLQDKIESLKQQQAFIPLEGQMLQLVLSRMKELHEIAGEDKLSFDLVSRTLHVRGDDVDLRQVRSTIDAMVASPGSVLVTKSVGSETCPVCFCDVTDATKLPCGDTYCRPCLHLLLQSASTSTSFATLACVATKVDSPETACHEKIPLSIIHDILLSHEESRALEAAFLAHIHARPQEYHYCPTPDCQTVYRAGTQGTTLQCPACMSKICPACHVEFHEGLTCVEHRDNLTGGMEAYQRWRDANNVKPCPSCGTDLEKNGGCNHIKCIRCNSHLCWVCMKIFPQSGVYEHMNRAHGGIGI